MAYVRWREAIAIARVPVMWRSVLEFDVRTKNREDEEESIKEIDLPLTVCLRQSARCPSPQMLRHARRTLDWPLHVVVGSVLLFIQVQSKPARCLMARLGDDTRIPRMRSRQELKHRLLAAQTGHMKKGTMLLRSQSLHRAVRAYINARTRRQPVVA